MKYTEKLTWILEPVSPRKDVRWDEEMNQRRVAFVRSLGLKCDIVGWAELDLSDPRSEEILRKIEARCTDDGWKARGYYERLCADSDSEWFEVMPSDFHDRTESGKQEIPCKNSRFSRLPTIHAYRESTAEPKGIRQTFVPSRFRKECLAQHIDDVDFCWLKDVGKYEAEQYFALYPARTVDHIGVCWKPRKTLIGHTILGAWDYRVGAPVIPAEMGGWLPKVAPLFYDLRITLQDCYLKEELPEDGIAWAHYNDGREPFYQRSTILLHRSLAQKLLEAKAIPPKSLRPAMVVSQLPCGYVCIDATEPDYPTADYLAQNLSAYETLISQPRPIRQIQEKEALTQLRRAKRERKEDFQKPLPKGTAEQLESTRYAPLIPYYRIANGDYLSPEYEYSLLSYDGALEENASFQNVLAEECLLENAPEGIVIAACPDGDRVLLAADGTVLRFSHEAPEILSAWPTLSQFFFEALTESD